MLTTIKRVLFALALLMPLTANAYTWVKPLPREFTANEHCQPYQTYTTPEAEIRVGWCHTDDPGPAGQWMWRPYVWQWCVKAKCNTVPAGFSVMNAIDTIKNASDQVAALQSLYAQLRMPYSATEKVHLGIVWARACKAMSAAPFPGAPPQGWTAGWEFPADYCPPEPAPPPPPPPPPAPTVPHIVAPWPLATYRSTYPFINGVRGTTSNGRVAILTGTLPTPCSCATAWVVEGTTTYCSVLGAATTVAACKLR